MHTKVEIEENKARRGVKRYPIRYSISQYAFPSDARIHQIRFDETFIHIELLDRRILSVPPWWIPSLYNASPDARGQHEISRGRRMIIWDLEKSDINDELRVEDCLRG